MVLHHELLSLPDGNLPAKRDRHGFVVHVYFCGADLGGVQCSSEVVGPTTWLAMEGLGMGLGCIRSFRRRLELDRQPLGFPAGVA